MMLSQFFVWAMFVGVVLIVLGMLGVMFVLALLQELRIITKLLEKK